MYSSVLYNTTEFIKNCDKIHVKRKAYNDLIQKITVSPLYLDDWYIMEREAATMEPNETNMHYLQKLRDISFSHFYYGDHLRETFIHNTGEIRYRFPQKNRKFTKVIDYPYFVEDFNFLSMIPLEFKRIKHLENILCFPHKFLEAAFYFYEKENSSFISPFIKKMYLKNLEKYNLLVKYLEENNVEKWIEILIGTGDDDIVIQNMEYYLTRKGTSIQAWKLYMNFLETNHYEAMLGVYSRYCKLIFWDREMRKEYQNKVTQYCLDGNDGLKWFIDLLKMEENDSFFLTSVNTIVEEIKTRYYQNLKVDELNVVKLSTILYNYYKKNDSSDSLQISDVWFMTNNYKLFETFDPDIFLEKIAEEEYFNDKKNDNNNFIIFSAKGIVTQKFSFCYDIIKYISKNSILMSKLQKTCKYFFKTFGTIIAYSLFITGNVQIQTRHYLLKIGSASFNKKITKLSQNLVVTQKVTIHNLTNKYCFSQVLTMCKIIEIKYLDLWQQHLTLNDLNILKEGCNLISIKFRKVKIFNYDNTFATVEDILSIFNNLKIVNLMQ